MRFVQPVMEVLLAEGDEGTSRCCCQQATSWMAAGHEECPARIHERLKALDDAAMTGSCPRKCDIDYYW